ncbi:MAG: MarR family transcriptional regulator [Eubacteriales bacterium]|nr:MarR family transcriptional regulator [Eubacteriales bacterium]
MSQKQNDLISLNQYSKEMDDLYHNYASRHGLSDAALWSLYHIWECSNDDHFCTQKEICESWSYSPQTTNSALKVLEERGLVKLEPVPENRKSKQIRLTSKGHALAEQVIVSLANAELEAFSALNLQEQHEYVRLSQKFVTALKDKIAQI